MNSRCIELKKQVSLLEKKIKELQQHQSDERKGMEEKYRLLYETMSQGVIYQAYNGEIISANPAAENLLGLTADQMQGKTSMDSRWKMIKEDGTPVSGDEHPTMLALKSGEKTGPLIRGVFHSKHNRYVWLSITSIPLFKGGEKKPYQAYATFENVTEKKLTQDRLKKSEESLQFALDSINLGAWELDLITQNVNRTLQHDKIFGYQELCSHWTPDIFTEHVHPEDLEYVKKCFENAIKQKEDLGFECRITDVDQKEKWIWVNGRHIKDEQGRYSRMSGILQDITERKKNELELQYREQFLASIIKHNPSGIAIHDKSLNYLFVSDRYLKDYKVKDHNIIGKHHYEVFPDLPEKWRKVHQKVLHGEIMSNEEDIYKKDDGTLEYTQWLCKPWYTKEGEIGGMILYTDLITERKMIEMEHRQTARKLELVLEHAGDGIFAVDTSDKATMINKAALHMLGYDKSDLLGKQMHSAHHHTKKDGNPYPLEKCPVQQVFRDGKINIQNDEVFWRKDGSSFPVEYISAPIKEEGKITGAVVSFRDITFRKKAEVKIQKLNNQLRQIIRTINRISRAESTELLQTIVADAARKLVNAKGTTFVIKDNESCSYVEEDTDTPLWKGKKFPLNKCITGWVMLNRKPAIIHNIYEDERIPIELYKNTFVKSLAVFPANEKDPKFTIGCYWDDHYKPDKEEIQLIKTLAEAANIGYENISLMKNLEAHVKERTTELELVNHELESFSYSVSHDLRAPLRAVNGFVAILMNEFGSKLNEEGMRLCNIIKVNTQKMDMLINDLLSFSRLTRKQIRMSLIDMQKLIESTYLEITNETDRNRIRITIKDMEACYGDPGLIKQVVTNILSNAIKYSSKKDKTVIEVFSKSKGNQIIYYCKDNGAGFDMKYKEKLFGVFQRLHNDADFEGNGIGLATVQRIIRRHGGIADAKGEPGKGSTFWFSLPRKKVVLTKALETKEYMEGMK